MTTTTRIGLGLSAALVSLGLAFAPAVFAQDKMGKDDGMKKESMSKDAMKKDDGMMKKDGMKHDGMMKDGMKKRRHEKELSRAVIRLRQTQSVCARGAMLKHRPRGSRFPDAPLRIPDALCASGVWRSRTSPE